MFELTFEFVAQKQNSNTKYIGALAQGRANKQQTTTQLQKSTHTSRFFRVAPRANSCRFLTQARKRRPWSNFLSLISPGGESRYPGLLNFHCTVTVTIGVTVTQLLSWISMSIPVSIEIQGTKLYLRSRFRPVQVHFCTFRPKK